APDRGAGTRGFPGARFGTSALPLCPLRECPPALDGAPLAEPLLFHPWYARNLVRYGVLTGTQEARAGVDLPTVLRVAPTVDWPAVVWSSVRVSLWTGNNSFSTFSANTLNLITATSLAALLLWVASRHYSAEWVTLLYCVLFALALGYAAVVSHIYTHGAANGPSPWYA